MAVRMPPVKSIRPVPIRLRTPSTSAHDARNEHAGFVRIVERHRKPPNVRLDLDAKLSDHPLRGFREQLRERIRGEALRDRRGDHRRNERDEEIRLFLMMTLSTRYFVEAGRISPETRLTTMRPKPNERTPRRGLRSSRTSGSCFHLSFGLAGWAGVLGLFSMAIESEDRDASILG